MPVHQMLVFKHLLQIWALNVPSTTSYPSASMYRTSYAAIIMSNWPITRLVQELANKTYKVRLKRWYRLTECSIAKANDRAYRLDKRLIVAHFLTCLQCHAQRCHHTQYHIRRHMCVCLLVLRPTRPQAPGAGTSAGRGRRLHDSTDSRPSTPWNY